MIIELLLALAIIVLIYLNSRRKKNEPSLKEPDVPRDGGAG